MTTPKEAEFPPRVDITQDDDGRLLAQTREEYSRDIFDYENQTCRFEYLSRKEHEHLMAKAVKKARADEFGFLRRLDAYLTMHPNEHEAILGALQEIRATLSAQPLGSTPRHHASTAQR